MRLTKEQFQQILTTPGYTIGHAAFHPYHDLPKSIPSYPKFEPPVRDEPLAEAKGEAANPASYVVRVVSYRRRLLDEDNLAPKYFIDGLRYAGLLPKDSPETCHIETRQVKVKGKENERTEIVLERYEA